MRFREISTALKEVSKFLEYNAKSYSNSTTSGNGTGDIMNRYADVINSCAEALDRKIKKYLKDPVQQIVDDISSCILDLEVSFNDGDEDKFQKAVNGLKHILTITNEDNT